MNYQGLWKPDFKKSTYLKNTSNKQIEIKIF